MTIRLNELIKGSKMPRRSTKWSAGYDVYSSQTVVLKAKEVVAVEIPYTVEFNGSDFEVLIFLRSSFGIKKNIRFYDINAEEIIPSYAMKTNKSKIVSLLNIGDEDVVLEKNMHFIQIVVRDKKNLSLPFTLENVENLNGKIPIKLSIEEEVEGGLEFQKTLVLQEEILLKVGESFMIPSGLKALIEKQSFLGGFVPRGEKRFGLCNGVPIIDSDYYNNEDNEGHMFFKVENKTNRNITLPVGTKIVDLISIPFSKISNEIAPESERAGGIGSTTK